MSGAWPGSACTRGSTPTSGRGPHRCRAICGTQLSWAAAIATPSMHTAHLGLAGPHDIGTEFIGTEFIRQVVTESHKVWLSHAKAREGLIRARAGPGGTMAWALRELQLHQQAQRQGVPRTALNYAHQTLGRTQPPHRRVTKRAHTHTHPCPFCYAHKQDIPAFAFW